jgi:lysylphosphatidylglycerol synthetase-like protein (DUF2156 family)
MLYVLTFFEMVTLIALVVLAPILAVAAMDKIFDTNIDRSSPGVVMTWIVGAIILLGLVLTGYGLFEGFSWLLAYNLKTLVK